MIKRLLSALSIVIGCGVLAYAATALTNYPPGFRTIDGSQLNKMVAVVNRLQGISATPTLSGCGISPSIVGSATAGQVTTGTSAPTGCTITFPTNYYSAAPLCTVTWASNVSPKSYVITAATLSLTQQSLSSTVVNYYCMAR
jgi:hypothetical protein